MSSLNKAMVIGRLGADPDVRYTQSNTAVANMSVATTERYKDRNGELQENTEWHRIVCWGRLAEICQQYLKKGSLAYFEGPIQTREWEDKEGQKRYTTEIKALTMQILDSRSSDQGGGGGGRPAQQNQNSNNNAPSKPASMEIDDSFDDMDDDLPF
jgi:single-strand DNA-binding protein